MTCWKGRSLIRPTVWGIEMSNMMAKLGGTLRSFAVVWNMPCRARVHWWRRNHCASVSKVVQIRLSRNWRRWRSSCTFNEVFSGEAKAAMLTYIGLNDIGAQPGVDSINSYPEAVQWLLLTYARGIRLAWRFTRSERNGPRYWREGTAIRRQAEKSRHTVRRCLQGARPHNHLCGRSASPRTVCCTWEPVQDRQTDLSTNSRARAELGWHIPWTATRAE